MDKAIEQIFKTFNHIARELQIYFISGFVVLLNIFVIDYFYNNSSFYKIVEQRDLITPLIIVAYILGHICMAFFYTILEWGKCDKKTNKRLGFKYKIDESVLPALYEKNKDTFIHFVERHIILSLMRWNLSSAFLICSIINLIFCLKKICEPKLNICLLVLLAVLYLFFSFSLYLLTSDTEREYMNRIKSMKKSMEKEPTTNEENTNP